MRSIQISCAAVAVACLTAAGIFAARAEAKPRTPRQASTAAIQTTDGRQLFTTYCASCHGATGTGNGPAAAALRRTPPDLTQLAAANGGVFPTERIRRIVDGRDVEAHGDRNMPVWGDAFKAMLGGLTEGTVSARVKAIVEYLSSIQRRQV